MSSPGEARQRVRPSAGPMINSDGRKHPHVPAISIRRALCLPYRDGRNRSGHDKSKRRPAKNLGGIILMSKLRLTVACGDYDIVKALKEGTVEAGGLELIFLTDMGPRDRHWRRARKMEFDVCEENVGAYFMARDRGDPVTAIPVFLHRRFRHGFVFINANAGIKSPKDLIGRQVGGTNLDRKS